MEKIICHITIEGEKKNVNNLSKRFFSIYMNSKEGYEFNNLTYGESIERPKFFAKNNKRR